MDFIASIYPGIGFSATLFLLGLSLGQFLIYQKKGYVRAFDLGVFCFFTAVYASNIAITHSRLFSAEFTWFYVVGLQPVLFIMSFYYLKAISYFLSVPGWLKKFYYIGNIIFGIVAFVPLVVKLSSGEDLYFFTDQPLVTSNFFVNSYTEKLGTPRFFPSAMLFGSSILNVTLTSVLIYRLRKSSKDIFLFIGLLTTLIVSGAEHLLIPFTLAYYVPVLFMSNVLEALRMCFLSTEESYSSAGLEKPEKEANVDHYQNTSFDEKRLEKLASILTNLLKEKTYYKNPNLKLEDLSHEMGIPSYQLTQVIRFGLKRNFYDLINSYRIKDVQEMLRAPEFEGETILDIALRAGFNSKSSFNTAFKNATGVTPSQYRKKELEAEA